MLFYIFLLAAASSELPQTDFTPEQMQTLQELAANVMDVAPAIEVATASATTEPSAPPVIAQPITITNAIEPSMLKYKHWTGKYSPEIFTVSVNGTEVECGKTCEISAETTTFEVSYTYSFMNGMRTGGKKISYQLNENSTQANITFDWKDDWRVVVDNAQAIKEITS